MGKERINFEREKLIDDGYFRIYNKMIEDKSEYRVTPNELYVYSLLFNNRRQDESMLASVRMIEVTMSKKVRFSHRQATNRQKIKEAIIGLVEKRVLIVTCDTDINNIKTDTFIILKINEQELNRNPKADTFNGYEELQIENFQMMLSAKELMIYILSQRFKKDGGFEASYERWAMFLNVSRNTAFKLVNEAEEREIITVKRGKYIAKNRQEINRYFSVSFIEEQPKQPKKEKSYSSQNETSVKEQQTEQGQPQKAKRTVKDKVVIAFGERPTVTKNEQGQQTGSFEELFGDTGHPF